MTAGKLLAYRLEPVYEDVTNIPASATGESVCLATGEPLAVYASERGREYLSPSFVNKLRAKVLVDTFCEAVCARVTEFTIRGGGGVSEPRSWAIPPWNQRWTINIALIDYASGGGVNIVYDMVEGVFMIWAPLSEDDAEAGADPFGGEPEVRIADPTSAAQWVVEHYVAEKDRI